MILGLFFRIPVQRVKPNDGESNEGGHSGRAHEGALKFRSLECSGPRVNLESSSDAVAGPRDQNASRSQGMCLVT